MMGDFDCCQIGGCCRKTARTEVISWEKSLEQGRAVSLSLDYGDEDPTIKFTVFGNDSARVLNLGAEEAWRIAEELGRFGDQLALIHEGGSA